MGRGLGSNTLQAAAFESTYGTPPSAASIGYLRLPMVSSALGEERPLIESDLLGLGRQPQDPTYDVATNTGDQVVPVDVRAFGWWLALLMGAPTTSSGGAATARLRFLALPAVNSTITVNGTVFTFVASGATGAQINIGADVATTIANAVTVLNASAVAGVALATYAAASPDLTIALDAAGLAGNGFTLAASTSPASNAALVGTADRILARWAFSSQPVNNATISINGQTLTFVTSGATGNQVNIGVNLAATLTAAAAFLNASRLPAFMEATYAADATTLFAFVRPGLATADYVTAAPSTSPASNATLTAAVAASCATGGTVSHLFTVGALALPSASIELGQPDVPAFSMHYGIRANQLRIGLARSGLLNATVGLIAKGEATATTSTAAGAQLFSPGVTTRFAQATGSISRNAAVLGSVVQAEITFSNNLETVDTIQADGRIEDADPGMVMVGASITTRYADTMLMDDATSQAPVALSFGWVNGPYSLTFAMPRVFLPRTKRPVEGPGGIQAQATVQASGALASAMTVTLVNDVPSYA